MIFPGRMKWILIPGATSNNTTEVWEHFHQRYIQISVTIADDRVVSIAGITAAFASKPRLRGAVCHSGVWDFRGWAETLCWQGILIKGNFLEFIYTASDTIVVTFGLCRKTVSPGFHGHEHHSARG